jgi:transcriptional regulator GlxA family with amidase domain
MRVEIVDEGDLITAGGVTSGPDLGPWLVERYFGAPSASAMEGVLEYQRRGVVWRRQSDADAGRRRLV